MSLAKMNIFVGNVNCSLLSGIWRQDLVIKRCNGSYLCKEWPEIIDQLKDRYSKKATVKSLSEFPLTTDQSGKTLSFQVGTSAAQQHVFTSPAMTMMEIYQQIKNAYTNVDVKLVDDQLVVTTVDGGIWHTLTIGGDCDIVWGDIDQASGFEISQNYYQGAERITMHSGSVSSNHIQVDVPPGGYLVWTRVCHGNNEETSVAVVNVRCGEEACVMLILPQVKTCAAQVVHPAIDKLVYEQALPDADARLMALRGMLYVAQVGKQDFLNQLAYRKAEAVAKLDTELEARVDAVIELANDLPECQ